MHVMRWIPLMLLSSALVGCAQAPTPRDFPMSTQMRMVTAEHWDLLAADVASRITPAVGGRPLFVRMPPTPTPFNTGFHDLLVTQLVQHGNVVTREQQGSLVLDYDVQVVSSVGAGPEVIINSSLSDGFNYLTSLSDIYYINAGNAGQYQAAPVVRLRTMQVVSQ